MITLDIVDWAMERLRLSGSLDVFSQESIESIERSFRNYEELFKCMDGDGIVSYPPSVPK